MAIAILCVATLGALIAWLLPRPPAPAAILGRANAALALGDADRASALAQAALARDGRLGVGHALLARAALAEDDGVGAEIALRAAASAGIDPARLHHLRADAMVLEGDAPGALREAARTIPPYRLNAARIAARAQALGGDPVGAQTALRGIVAAHPGDGPAWLDLGRLSLGMGQPDIAGDALARARTLLPRDPGVRALAIALRRATAIAPPATSDRAVGGDR